jgi:hypothetical protein
LISTQIEPIDIPITHKTFIGPVFGAGSIT